MPSYTEILVIAALAQLAVLPGEKVQFIIAGLSARYHPLGVVAAAGTAFAGWTALEIWFGRALQRALSPLVLDSITAVLFLTFAYLLARSAPEAGQNMAAVTDGGADDSAADATVDDPAAAAERRSDGGVPAVEDFTIPVLDREVPDAFGSYVPIFLLMAAGEFGDKTQLVTIGLAIKYGATSAIWAGEMLAIIPVSLLNAYFFHRFAHLFEMRKAHFAAAVLFAFFGLDTVLAITTGFSVWETVVTNVSSAVLARV